MEIYIVKNIFEADYGCEETGRETTMALMRLDKSSVDNPDNSDNGVKHLEISEAYLASHKISEGDKVCINESGDVLKYVRVVAAVISDTVNGKKKYFAAARGYGEYKGWWEFPGGKIESGETSEQALVREIREELTAEIDVGELIRTVEYDYPDFHLSMDCFYAEIRSGQLVLKEAMEARWFSPEEFDEVRWLPADLELIDTIKKI
jgi:8-oxo-dGTP diphosphatase